jgi:hypothetical protein
LGEIHIGNYVKRFQGFECSYLWKRNQTDNELDWSVTILMFEREEIEEEIE